MLRNILKHLFFYNKNILIPWSLKMFFFKKSVIYKVRNKVIIKQHLCLLQKPFFLTEFLLIDLSFRHQPAEKSKKSNDWSIFLSETHARYHIYPYALPNTQKKKKILSFLHFFFFAKCRNLVPTKILLIIAIMKPWGFRLQLNLS